MKVLIVGSGGREHAIVWKLAQSPRVSALYAAPGNAGTAALGTNLAVAVEDFPALAEAVRAHRIDLVVVGPEVPLVAGIVDFFQARGVPIFGPDRRAARIEGSKAFARALMRKHGIPCGEGEVFDSYEAARAFIERQPRPPVVKADGLAAGKGVVVPATRAEAIAALDAMMLRGAFGEAGRRVVLEERLEGAEASVFAITDGRTVLPTVPACDYKRALDGDQGLNTGGMGSYSPPEFLDEALVQRIHQTVLEPAVRAMAMEGSPFRGVLYAGLMVQGGEVNVLEFNCRLGDPETQVILPRLRTDLLDVIEAALAGRLDQVRLEWDPRPCAGVVMAAGGYPGPYEKGHPIAGLGEIDTGAAVFHAGTRLRDGQPVTDGGRVLTVVALGRDIAEARRIVYANVQRVRFKDAHYRTDIALRALRVAP